MSRRTALRRPARRPEERRRPPKDRPAPATASSPWTSAATKAAVTPPSLDTAAWLRRAERLGHRPPPLRQPGRLSRLEAGSSLQPKFADSNNMKDFLVEQAEAQQYAAYEETPFTTVGFEHEFSQMLDGPLLGVTHVELADSEEKMPFTGLRFSLETDADDAVELVSPPFILETISKKAPIPKPDDVAKVDHMIQQRLAELTSSPQTFGELLEGFGSDPGVTFRPQNVTVTSSNVNPEIETDFSKLVEEEKKNQAKVPVKTVLGMTVGKGRKSSLAGAISAQVNFATDFPTYQQTVEASREEPFNQTRVFLDLEGAILEVLVGSIPEDEFYQPSPAFRPFLGELARRLASSLAAPSISEVESAKQEIFEGEFGAKKKYGKGKSGNRFSLQAGLRSHVKDTKSLWLKDTLENVGLGILPPDDWRLVRRMAFDTELHGRLRGLELNPKGFKKDERQVILQNLEGAREMMVHGLKRLGTRILTGGWQYRHAEKKTSKSISGPEKQPPFGSHDLDWLGARQDTFLPGKSLKESTPPAWKGRRLHVVETRGNAIQTLLDAEIARLVVRTKKTDKEIAKRVTKRIETLLEDAEKRLEAASKNLSKNEELPHNVKMLKNLVKAAQELSASEEHVKEIRERLGG